MSVHMSTQNVCQQVYTLVYTQDESGAVSKQSVEEKPYDPNFGQPKRQVSPPCIGTGVMVFIGTGVTA